MPAFSTKSNQRLSTCDDRLQLVLKRAILRYDFTILCGHRGREEQEDAFERGTTQKHWPDSKHNKAPSLAADCAPYPIDWDNLDRFREMARVILDEANKAGIKLRWGGDFNMNGKPDDKFKDYPHFEIYERSK
jgi:peptidoglycan L-alanyl-D-glutamate endopeptidase CwlK